MERKIVEKIVKSIVLEEKNEHDIEFDFKVCTRKEYYKSEEFKKSLKGSNIVSWLDFIILPGESVAYYSPELNYFVIFIDQCVKGISDKEDLINLVFTTYHEIYHAYQNNKTKPDKIMSTTGAINNFNLQNSDLFLYQLEKLVKFEEYKKSWTEISANNYALLKTIDYVNENCKNTNYEDYINDASSINEIRRITYDFNDVFNLFNKIIREKYVDVKGTWLELFYNNDYSFKTISEISTNMKNYDLDQEIVGLIMTSDLFFKNVKTYLLSDEERNIYFDIHNYREQLKKYKEAKIECFISKHKEEKVKTKK